MFENPRPSRILAILGALFGGLVATACATGPDGHGAISDANVVRWVQKAVAERLPTAYDKRFDEVAWVTDIRSAIQLGTEYNRPIFLLTVDGRINTGRC